ncbi:hypothetical protein BT63DRAFT_272060 [Microthyrium microscopicum]|uniref:Uncharacterized protein n=1 Tax=Microthyrium microscopicum TaxID=703497 RepID=A0A6A6U9Y1_9PEZI|nr:hypothetical protein BT63DRAFT_272060 [Microthyrium microscopicum]
MRKFKLRILFILLSNGLAESIPQDPQKFGNLPYFTLARSAVGQPSPAPPAPALPPPAISPSSNGSPISVPPPAPPAAVTPIPPAQLSVPPPAVPAASSPLPAVPLPQTSAASGAGQLPPQPVAVPPPPGLGTPAAPSNVGPASFGQILQIAGNMARTDITLKDGFGIDLLSPKNRSMIVLQNNKPLSGNFVTGASGSGFMALSPYSYVVRTSDLANDLIAKVELPFNREAIANAGVKSADTFVGKLAPDGKSWQVVEDQRNVHNQEDKTRIEKMTSIAGEYMLLGRKNVDDGNIFIQYGSGEELAVSIAGGQGVQQAEYIDGLRLTIESAGKMSINADVKALSGPNVLPKGVMSLSMLLVMLVLLDR